MTYGRGPRESANEARKRNIPETARMDVVRPPGVHGASLHGEGKHQDAKACAHQQQTPERQRSPPNDINELHQKHGRRHLRHAHSDHGPHGSRRCEARGCQYGGSEVVHHIVSGKPAGGHSASHRAETPKCASLSTTASTPHHWPLMPALVCSSLHPVLHAERQERTVATRTQPRWERSASCGRPPRPHTADSHADCVAATTSAGRVPPQCRAVLASSCQEPETQQRTQGSQGCQRRAPNLGDMEREGVNPGGVTPPPPPPLPDRPTTTPGEGLGRSCEITWGSAIEFYPLLALLPLSVSPKTAQLTPDVCGSDLGNVQVDDPRGENNTDAGHHATHNQQRQVRSGGCYRGTQHEAPGGEEEGGSGTKLVKQRQHQSTERRTCQSAADDDTLLKAVQRTQPRVLLHVQERARNNRHVVAKARIRETRRPHGGFHLMCGRQPRPVCDHGLRSKAVTQVPEQEEDPCTATYSRGHGSIENWAAQDWKTDCRHTHLNLGMHMYIDIDMTQA